MEKSKFKVDYMNNKIMEVVSECEHKTLAIWATDCAEHVLAYFEEKYPYDRNPRNAIEAGRAWVSGELKMTDARKAAFASHTSAREVSDDSATAVARACGHAAATAHVATHAPHAAAYAAKAVGYAKKDINEERDWQYNHLVELFNSRNV
ncbi:MAG TPA: hypothetical protein VIK78_06080 [Ruminiclostridium sp.]